ncbi:MAG: hypothetical protein AAB422_06510 [Planctomycetota bacterium]
MMSTRQTNEKMAPVSKALSEVWEWKDAVYKDIKNMSFEEKRVYFEKGLKEAVKMIKGKVKTNSDGSYSIVKDG